MKIEFKKVLIYAITPAVIAGLFSIAPKLYDIIVEPTAELTYAISSGPELEEPNGYRKIISIEITNSGKKPLSNIAANLQLDKGKIDTHKVQEESGLNPSIKAKEKEVAIEIGTLHQNESFTVSAMLFAPTEGASPNFTLRSKETLGKQFVIEPDKRERKLDLIGAILASISVFVMATTVMVRRKPLFSILTGGKQDVLFYIAARLNLPAISNEMRLIDTRLTYLRMADILMAHGLITSAEDRENTVKALKCLLLVSGIAETSLAIVTNNIKTLEGEDYSDEEIELLRNKAVSVDDQLVIRDLINKYIENDLAFLTNPANEKA